MHYVHYIHPVSMTHRRKNVTYNVFRPFPRAGFRQGLQGVPDGGRAASHHDQSGREARGRGGGRDALNRGRRRQRTHRLRG